MASHLFHRFSNPIPTLCALNSSFVSAFPARLQFSPTNPSIRCIAALKRCDFAARAAKSDQLPSSSAESVVTVKDEKYGNKEVICVTPKIYDYILANVREPEILRKLREETANMRGSQMQVSPDQAQLLALLVQILEAQRCIEVGVYTGYSSLAVALALPESGRLVACERDEQSLEIAKKYYEKAGVSHKVDVRHGLAADTLKALILNGEACSFDFAFVDAEKKMYQEYFELLLQLVKVGGLIVIDNVLWHGKVADPLVNDPKTLFIRNFNKNLMEDKRVSISMVPIGDGMTICRKRFMCLAEPKVKQVLPIKHAFEHVTMIQFYPYMIKGIAEGFGTGSQAQFPT